MRILLSNDDGYLAPGLAALYEALKPIADVTVMAPEQNCSGASNSLTLSRPLSVLRSANGFYYVNGTPTDSVHIALTGMLDHTPDLVVSGINNGQNMGEDTLYSGTVAAATEGFMFGVPAIAFSLVDKDWAHLDDAARVAAEIVAHYLEQPLPGHPLLNVNIPNLPYEQLDELADHASGQAPSVAAGDPPEQPARRTDLLDWAVGQCARRERRHRFPCGRQRPRVDHAVAARSDPYANAARGARLGARRQRRFMTSERAKRFPLGLEDLVREPRRPEGRPGECAAALAASAALNARPQPAKNSPPGSAGKSAKSRQARVQAAVQVKPQARPSAATPPKPVRRAIPLKRRATASRSKFNDTHRVAVNGVGANPRPDPPSVALHRTSL